jgi:hypothetical protein
MAKKFDAKAKAKRQTIIAAVLGVLLLGVLAYEVPSLMKSMNKKPPGPTAAVAPTQGTPIAGGPVTAAPAAALAPVTTLSDSDPAVQAGSGQLLSFDRFSTKDPFVQQVDAKVCNTDPTASDAPTCVTGAPPPPVGKLKPKKQSTTPAPPPPTQATAAPATARISINGTRELVDVGKTFPSSDPVFRLVSLMRTTAKIGIAGGSLSTGGATTTLTKGKKVTLMNTADGTRYELVLVAVF